jgi:hypothetical protein
MNLHGSCTPATLAAAFARHGAFPFPAAGLPATPSAARRVAAVVASARAQLVKPWPALPVSLYLRYFRDGDRSAFELPYFHRRRRLGAAALAWVATGEAVFADELADGVGLVCDESTWCVPAHARHSLTDEVASCLPGPGSGGYIDLFNCETALVLAEACQLAGPALDGVDGRLRERAREEIRRRVLDPILGGATPWWMQGGNNWSVWCASSLLVAAGFALHGDPSAWGRLAHRMIGVADRYVERQAPDGGCDEGVMYWSVAGGCVGRLIEELRLRTGGMVDGWQADPRVREIMRFPGRMHLGGGTFPAFADGGPRPTLPVGVLARSAAALAAPELLALARLLAAPERETDVAAIGVGDLLPQQLRSLWWFETAAAAPTLVLADAWLPDLQVVVAHGGGTALAAKGGHNDENHNHCDVGQFVVHRHGVPLLVDAGRGNYTAQTFSPRRYELCRRSMVMSRSQVASVLRVRSPANSPPTAPNSVSTSPPPIR